MAVKHEKQILIFLHHFQEHFHNFSLQKVADSKDFNSGISYQRDAQNEVWPKILITRSNMIVKNKTIFCIFLHHFCKNPIFTSFLDHPNNQSNMVH